MSPPPERAAGGHYPGSDAGSESSTTSSVPHGIGLKSADAVAVGDLVPVCTWQLLCFTRQYARSLAISEEGLNFLFSIVLSTFVIANTHTTTPFSGFLRWVCPGEIRSAFQCQLSQSQPRSPHLMSPHLMSLGTHVIT